MQANFGVYKRSRKGIVHRILQLDYAKSTVSFAKKGVLKQKFSFIIIQTIYTSSTNPHLFHLEFFSRNVYLFFNSCVFVCVCVRVKIERFFRVG